MTTPAISTPQPPPLPLLPLTSTPSTLTASEIVADTNLALQSSSLVLPLAVCLSSSEVHPQEHSQASIKTSKQVVAALRNVENSLTEKRILVQKVCRLLSPERNWYCVKRIKRGFGTKSAYYPPHPEFHVERISPYSCGGGSIVHVSLLARHGTRNPTRGHLSRLRDLELFLGENANPSNGTKQKSAWLAEFGSRIAEWEKDPGALAAEGVEELRAIGGRFRQRYGECAPENVRIRSSHKSRAMASAEAFLDGYGRHEIVKVDILESGKRDQSLRFYDKVWNKQYADFASSHKKEMRKAPYNKDAYVQVIAKRVADGLRCDKLLPGDYLRRLVEYCAIERAQKRKPVADLDSLFTTEDLLHLERFEKRYTPFFHGHKLFNDLSAPFVKDLVQSLEAAIRKTDSGSAFAADANPRTCDLDLRFAHAETLIPLLLLMKIRSFDGSHDLGLICPFGGNLSIELWAPPEDGPNANAGYRVKFRLHEIYVDKIETIRGGDKGWVELDALTDFFSEVLRRTN